MALGPICPSCGAGPLPAGVAFCTACGTELARPGVLLERKIVSVVFVDLVGFTAMSEALDPEEVRRLLAPYYQRLREELEGYGGTVEKFIGDAVMALFGAPVAHEDDADGRCGPATPCCRRCGGCPPTAPPRRCGCGSGSPPARRWWT